MRIAFYFFLKALFVFKIFKVLSCFDHVEKNGLIRKIRLISKFMMTQPGQQTIAIHILANISQSKGNQTNKFGHVRQYNRIVFPQNYAENESRTLVTKPLLFALFFEKPLYELSGLQAQFQYISIVLILAYNKTKLYKTLHY